MVVFGRRKKAVDAFIASGRPVLKIRGGRGSLKTQTGAYAASQFAGSGYGNVLFVTSSRATARDVRKLLCDHFNGVLSPERSVCSVYRIRFEHTMMPFCVDVVPIEMIRVIRGNRVCYRMVVVDEAFCETAFGVSSELGNLVHAAQAKVLIYSREVLRDCGVRGIAGIDLMKHADVRITYRDVPEELLGRDFFAQAEQLKEFNENSYRKWFLDLGKKKDKKNENRVHVGYSRQSKGV